MIPELKKYTFYRKTSHGISTWTIWYQGSTIFYGFCMVEGGVQRVDTEDVILNQSGRDLQQQIELQMRSRLSRMLDKGYKTSREEALLGSTNQLGLVNPMLAHPLDKVATPYIGEDRPAHVQIKYDGHRCLITRFEGRMIAYTRKGKLIHTINHVLEVLDKRLPEGVTVDGELYIHGQPLQAISSLIKRDQAASRNLIYHIYDVVDDRPFSERWGSLTGLIAPIQTPHAHLVPTQRVASLGAAFEHFRQARADGHEGSMLRIDLRGYEDGRRSDQLLKVKERSDEDFRVLDVKPGKNQIGILVLQLNDRAATFDCTAPGGVPEKQEILANKHKYIGRWATVAFANKTNDGVPFHGVALRFVEEI